VTTQRRPIKRKQILAVVCEKRSDNEKLVEKFGEATRSYSNSLTSQKLKKLKELKFE